MNRPEDFGSDLFYQRMADMCQKDAERALKRDLTPEDVDRFVFNNQRER